MISRTSWRESKLLKTFYREAFFLCLQIWPLPDFHLDPRAAKWYLSTRGHVGHFLLLSTKKGKRKGFQSEYPSKMGPCTGCFGHCHCSWDAEEQCMGHQAVSSGAEVTASTAEPSWCDMAFCLYEGLNVSLYGAMTLWFPRLAFQTPVCAYVCICIHESEGYTCTGTHPHLLTQVSVSTQAHSIACKVN